ncbi:hypothetical protein HK104_003762 [Borealophlyctis nickersoniae]|nr:hypothetical protein HK104_003762 [Borealophlyctis nickersoniae]
MSDPNSKKRPPTESSSTDEAPTTSLPTLPATPAIVDRLHTLLTIPFYPETANSAQFYQEQFRRIANGLLNDFVLCAGPTAIYRLLEIEFYLRDNVNGHFDPFTHGQPQQSKFAEWYGDTIFRGGSYVGGTFKGMDITYGRTYEVSKPSPYFAGVVPAGAVFQGGILVRALERVVPGSVGKKGDVIEGPCRCVEALMADFGYEAVKDLVERGLGENLDASISGKGALFLREAVPTLNVAREDDEKCAEENGDASVHPAKRQRVTDVASAGTTASLTPIPLPRRQVLETPRIGLYLRDSHVNIPSRIEYVGRPYRFLTAPKSLSKNKPLAALGIARMMTDPVHTLVTSKWKKEYATSVNAGGTKQPVVPIIVGMTGMAAKMAEKCLAAYEQGMKDANPEGYVGNKLANAETLCKFVGAVDGWRVKDGKEKEGKAGKGIEME